MSCTLSVVCFSFGISALHLSQNLFPLFFILTPHSIKGRAGIGFLLRGKNNMDGKLCPLFNEKREVGASLPSRSLLDLNLFPFLTLLLYHLFFSPVLQLFILQSILVSLQHCISSEPSIFRKWFGLRHLDKPFGKGYCSIPPADTLLECFPFPSPQCL